MVPWARLQLQTKPTTWIKWSKSCMQKQCAIATTVNLTESKSLYKSRRKFNLKYVREPRRWKREAWKSTNKWAQIRAEALKYKILIQNNASCSNIHFLRKIPKKSEMLSILRKKQKSVSSKSSNSISIERIKWWRLELSSLKLRVLQINKTGKSISKWTKLCSVMKGVNMA